MGHLDVSKENIILISVMDSTNIQSSKSKSLVVALLTSLIDTVRIFRNFR